MNGRKTGSDRKVISRFSSVCAAHCQQMKVHAPVIVIKSFHKLGQGMVFQPAAGIMVPQVFLKRYRIIPGNTEEKGSVS